MVFVISERCSTSAASAGVTGLAFGAVMLIVDGPISSWWDRAAPAAVSAGARSAAIGDRRTSSAPTHVATGIERLRGCVAP